MYGIADISVVVVKSSSALMVVEEEEGGDEEATVEELSDEEDLDVFQPTDHWQTLKPGKAVRDL